MDSNEGMIEKISSTKLILAENYDSSQVKKNLKYDPGLMISFHDFCLLMGFHDKSMGEMQKKSSDIIVFVPTTKIKRSKSMPL